MATRSDRLAPVARAGATVAFGLVALGAAAVVWTLTFLSWWQAIGLESAAVPATAAALVPLVGLGYVAVVAEGGPTPSMAAYVGGFAAASVAFVAAVWTTVFLVALLPLGVTTAATAAGAVALLAALVVGPVLGLYVAGGATLVLMGLLARREFAQVRAVEEHVDATPTTADDLPGIHAVTTKVAGQLGVPKPSIAVSETYAPEALVVGFRPSDVHLVLSYGAVTALDDDELEAVIAHELAHVANRDAMVMTALSTPVVLADGLRARVGVDFLADDDEEWERPEEPTDDEMWGSEEIFGPNDEWRMEHPNESADENTDDDGWFVRMTLSVVATIARVVGRAIVAVLSRSRELSADRTAAELTGSPAALAGALRTLDDRIEATPNRDLREVAGVSSLSILPLEPVGADSDEPSALERLRTRLFRTHPPTERRLAELEALERELH